MNIQTVAENLRNTIKGKEAMLGGLKSTLDVRDTGARMSLIATREFLEINIDELKRILQDVEKCVAKDVEQSWRDNPDRSGGQFTQEEIDTRRNW